MNYHDDNQLAKSLRKKLGEEQAESLVTYIEQNIKDEFDTKKEILATKQNISELKDRIDAHFKWLIGLFIGQMVFVLGLVYFVLTYVQK